MKLQQICSILFISTGILLILFSTSSLIKIKKGSKSVFAYILMSFTVVDGLHWIVFGFYPDNEDSFIGFSLNQYVFAMTLLQAWIFAMRYLESALKCTVDTPCISPRLLKLILWLGIAIYSSILSFMIILSGIEYARLSEEKWICFYKIVYIVTFLTVVVMSVVCAFITVFAIHSMLKTVRILE